MHIYEHYWFSFGTGFLIGTLGFFLLSLLSLAIEPIEIMVQPLFFPGRLVSQMIVPTGIASTQTSTLLFTLNGILYGLLGMFIHYLRKIATR